MNIVFLSPLPPHPGGISEFSYNLIQELSKFHNLKIVNLKIFPIFFLNKLGLYHKSQRIDFKQFSSMGYELFNIFNPFSYLKYSYFTNTFSHLIIPFWNTLYFPIYFPIMLNKIFFNKQTFVLIVHNVEDHSDFFFKKLIRKLLFSFFDKFIVHSYDEFLKLSKNYNIHKNKIIKLQHPIYFFDD